MGTAEPAPITLYGTGISANALTPVDMEATMKKLWMCLAAIGGLAMLASPAFAADKTLALVVKGLDNPYFDLMHQGCERANKELNKQGYTCYYTGPATAADESAEVQIIDDLLTKGVAGMAISPANAPAVAEELRRRNVTIPVITADADLLPKDASLRKSYVGTDNYELGVKLGEQLKLLMPKGGNICLVMGNPAAENINQRAQGTRDTLSGKKGIAEARRRKRLEGDQRLPALRERRRRQGEPDDAGHADRQRHRSRCLRARRRLAALCSAGLFAGRRADHG